MRSFTSHDTLCLQKFVTILCAGLESSHVPVANGFMEMWNSTFGLQESLAHPEPLSRALVKANAIIGSHAAGLRESNASEVCLTVLGSRFQY